METSVACPYCGEENLIVIDTSGGRQQQYVEDCQVCCKPWQVVVTTDSDGEIDVELRSISE
jgi:transposase-like protein